MDYLLAILAGLGFVFSLVVHVAAWCGRDVSTQVPPMWLLHLGIFVVFIPMVLSSQKRLGSRMSIARLRTVFPGWVVTLGLVLSVYVVLNFLFFMLSTREGSPGLQHGKFILQSHGHFIRELTSAEYTALKANVVRGFSGHWLIFYYLPFTYFMFAPSTNPAVAQTA
jgi:hypothetical protein